MTSARVTLKGTVRGGVEGATVVLHPLNTGHILSPAELVRMSGGTFQALRSLRSPREEWLHLPVPAFLIKRAKKMVLDVATECLRKRVMAGA